MQSSRLIALFASGAGLAGAALLLLRGQEDGEPAKPVEPEEIGSGDVGAGIPTTQDEVEALARTIASEAGSGTLDEQCAIGWTVRNRFRGKSIYATQYPWRSQKGSNPPFASARPASDSHRKLAAEILTAPQSQDPTGGATSFFEPRMQDAFAKAGAMARAGETGDRVIDGVKLSDITRFKNYKKNADEIRKSWSKGSAPYATVGRFEFWGSASALAKRGNPAPREVAVGLECLGAV
jgi:hypothetical protein